MKICFIILGLIFLISLVLTKRKPSTPIRLNAHSHFNFISLEYTDEFYNGTLARTFYKLKENY